MANSSVNKPAEVYKGPETMVNINIHFVSITNINQFLS